MPDRTITAVPTGVQLTVGDVVRSPALQLRLLAGERGLERNVSWAHVSELPDPTPWLLGAEMILTTGLAVPTGAAAQRSYLERLDDAGVSALAISAQLHAPVLTRDLFATADERGLALLEVPLSVPFVVIVQEVAAAASGDDERLAAQLQVFGALRWLTEEALDTSEIFGRLELLSGYRLTMCTVQGRPLLPGVPVPDRSELALLPAPGSQAPPSVPGGFVLPVPAPGGTAGYLLARAQKGLRPAGLAVVQHIATVAALQLTMLRHQREIVRRQGAEMLAEMIGGLLDAGAVRRGLHRAAFDPDAPLVLAVAQTTGGEMEEAALVADLDEAGIAHLLLRRDADLVLLAPPGAELVDVLARVTGLRCGLSAPFHAGDALELPRREARWALARTRETGRSVVVYDPEDVVGRWLPRDVAALRALVERVLGPALRYDAQRRTSLVETVTVWLRHDRRAEAAAAALHVHPNTLGYRLRRFSELTGADLDTTADLAEVWLAVRAAEDIAEPA